MAFKQTPKSPLLKAYLFPNSDAAKRRRIKKQLSKTIEKVKFERAALELDNELRKK